MSHTASEAFYQQIRREADAFIAQGLIHFFEGVQLVDVPDSLPNEVKLIAYAIRAHYAVTRQDAEAVGMAYQAIQVPAERRAINADVTVVELARKLLEFGYMQDLPTEWAREFEQLSERQQSFAVRVAAIFTRFQLKIPDSVVLALRHRDGMMPNGMLDKKSPSQVPAEGVDVAFNFRASSLGQADRVIWICVFVDGRNERAVEIIEGHVKASMVPGGYVTYGQDHIPGLMRLFEQQNWSIIDHTTLDTADFA